MKSTGRKILTVVLIVLVCCVCIGGLLIWRHQSGTIGRDAALDIALEAAGLSSKQAYDIDVEYEKERGNARYEVDFDGPAGEYTYLIDAVTGEILSSRTEP
ncbi:MAG: PepSY domain-containing protein [Oscillospiraceae bacterium]|nr:PepSY domain-containing protein [Oscillospiraceae bacterium]